jgi:hypothetical protein
VLEGSNPSLAACHRLVRALKMKAIEVDAGSAAALDAAITLGTGALTPLLEHTAGLLRRCGLRDSESLRLAAELFAKTTMEYSHSGRQSWAWFSQEPDGPSLRDQLNAVGSDLRPLLGELILSGLRELNRHPELERRIRAAMLSDESGLSE